MPKPVKTKFNTSAANLETPDSAVSAIGDTFGNAHLTIMAWFLRADAVLNSSTAKLDVSFPSNTLALSEDAQHDFLISVALSDAAMAELERCAREFEALLTASKDPKHVLMPSLGKVTHFFFIFHPRRLSSLPAPRSVHAVVLPASLCHCPCPLRDRCCPAARGRPHGAGRGSLWLPRSRAPQGNNQLLRLRFRAFPLACAARPIRCRADSPTPCQLTHEFVGCDVALAGARACFNFKLDKVQMACLDGTSIPLEKAGGKCAVMGIRVHANCSKDAGGKATADFLGCSIVSATEPAETDRSLLDLPPFEGANASEARFSTFLRLRGPTPARPGSRCRLSAAERHGRRTSFRLPERRELPMPRRQPLTPRLGRSFAAARRSPS